MIGSRRGVFLLGPPGAGKTALGSAACTEFGLRFLDLPGDASPEPRALDEALARADVIALPWLLVTHPALLRRARQLGAVVGLWAHPEEMHARAWQPITLTPRRGLVTRGGFGRHGTSCVEFRRLERASDHVLHLDGLSEGDALGELVSLLRDLAAEADPAARLNDLRSEFEEALGDSDPPPRSDAIKPLAGAMASFVASRADAGASPRTLGALRSDLQAAALLVFMYESPRGKGVLGHFRGGAPLVFEFSRKFSDSPALVARYERNLGAFAEFLERTERATK